MAFCNLIRVNLSQDRFYAALSWCIILDWISNLNDQVLYKLVPGRDAALILSKCVKDWFSETLAAAQNDTPDGAVKFHTWVHFLAGLISICSDVISNILCPVLEIDCIRAIQFFMPAANSSGPRPSHQELLMNGVLSGICTILRYGQAHPYPKLEAVHVAKKIVVGKKSAAPEAPKPPELELEFLVTQKKKKLRFRRNI